MATTPNGSFIENVNTLASKMSIIESANSTFDVGIVPVLQEIASINLDEAITDLKKGDYLGNRKIDIDLALNVPGITEALIANDLANKTSFTTDTVNTLGDSLPKYSSATITFTDGHVEELPFKTDDMLPTTVGSVEGLYHQLTRLDNISAQAQVSEIADIIPVNSSIYIISINGQEYSYLSDNNATIDDITASLNQKITLDTSLDAVLTSVIQDNKIVCTSKTAGIPFSLKVQDALEVDNYEFSAIVKQVRVYDYATYSVNITVGASTNVYSYTSTLNASETDIINGLANAISVANSEVTVSTSGSEILIKVNDNSLAFEVTYTPLLKAITTTENVVQDFVETGFNKYLQDTQLMISPSIPMSKLRFYDVTGRASNLERIVLHVAINGANNADPVYYWGATTSAFKALSSRAGDIIKLGAEIDNLIQLSSNIAKVMDVQDSLQMLTDGSVTIYSKLSVLQTLYDNLTSISTIYDDLINTVTGSAITRVSNDLASANSHVTKVYDDLVASNSKILEVANNLQDANSTVTTVGNDIQSSTSKLLTIANDLQSPLSKLVTLFNDMVAVDSSIKEVATNLQLGLTSDILIVSKDIQLGTNSSLLTVGTDLHLGSNSVITTVSDNIHKGTDSEVLTVSQAIVEPSSTLNTALANATTALTARDASIVAQEASEAARDIAISKSNEIKNVSVGNTQTVLNGSPASVTYDNTTGTFDFKIPKGPKGDGFAIDATGVDSDKGNYDDELKGFSFLATDTQYIYFKQSDTSGDWSDGVVFGKGDQGVGIDRIERTDGTGAAGEDDTYTIFLTNGTETTFKVHNGANVIYGSDIIDKMNEIALIMY